MEELLRAGLEPIRTKDRLTHFKVMQYSGKRLADRDWSPPKIFVVDGVYYKVQRVRTRLNLEHGATEHIYEIVDDGRRFAIYQQRISGLRARKHRIRRVLKGYDIERQDASWQKLHVHSIDVLNWKKTPRPGYYVNDLEGSFDGKRRHWKW